LAVLKGATDVTVYVFIQDSSSTTGAGLTGLAYNTASLVCYYVRPLAAAAALTLATQTVTGAHSDGGFVEVDATNMPGVYRLDLSDTIVASGVNSVALMLKGAANMAPVLLELQLVSYNPNDAVRLGLTALPNAAAEAAGGLYTRGTGAGQINQNANGQIDVNAVAISGDATAADNLETACDGGSYNVGGGAIVAASVTGAVGSVTGAVGSVTGNVGGNVVGSVGSVVGAVGSVTGAVGSVTGNVGGNVAGSVGSVVGNVGGNVTGSVGSVATGGITAASFAADSITAAALATDAVNEIAGAVWDVTLSGHLTAGSTGFALNAAGSAGDPWSTALPGAYAAGTAGYIVGTTLDALVSSRLSPTVAGRTLDVSAGGEAGVDWANVGSPTSSVNLSGTTVGTVTALAAGAIAAASFASAALDAIANIVLGYNMSSVTGAASRSLLNAIRFLRNKWSISGTTLTVTQEDDTTAAWTATLTTNASAEPITSSDPA